MKQTPWSITTRQQPQRAGPRKRRAGVGVNGKLRRNKQKALAFLVAAETRRDYFCNYFKQFDRAGGSFRFRAFSLFRFFVATKK
jgi:hypothetical protein